MFCEAFTHWHEILRALRVFRVCRLVARGEFRKLAVLIFVNLGPFTFLLLNSIMELSWGPCTSGVLVICPFAGI